MDKLWNPSQQQAVDSTEGAVMVISCAGSGKTTVILERADRIAELTGRPSRILVVTFSKAAAEELEERYRRTYGRGGIRFATIHSICYSVLAGTYGLTADAILKERDRRKFFLQLHTRLLEQGEEIDGEFDDFYGAATAYISKIMSSGGKAAGQTDGDKEQLYRRVGKAYTDFKKRNRKVDFDDMIVLCYRCLKENPQILEYWQGVFDYIMIDEYQDTSGIQADIFFMLSQKHGNICVVGDDDQSVYGFRGADSSIFMKFQQRFPGCRKIFMTVNYRSLPGIVECSARLIGHNRERFRKEFGAARKNEPTETAVRIIRCGSELKQVEAVLRGIDEWLKQGNVLKDMAVLYRVKNAAVPLVNRLLLEKIPFFIREMPMDIHKGMIYQDVLAYYRLSGRMEEPGDLLRIINRPKRYLKNNLVRGCRPDKYELYNACTRAASTPYEYDRINDVINQLFLDLRNLKGLPPGSFLEYLDKDMGYREALKEYAEYRKLEYDDLERDFTALAGEAGSFPDMESWISYVEESGSKGYSADPEGIYLSTFHGAKGLEWKKVYILSADEKITPCQRNGRYEDMEEERRLFYVAATRARDCLRILSASGSRGRKLSRFAEEMAVKE